MLVSVCQKAVVNAVQVCCKGHILVYMMSLAVMFLSMRLVVSCFSLREMLVVNVMCQSVRTFYYECHVLISGNILL